MGKGGSSNGTTWIRLELDKPLPMVKLLKQLPPVKEAFSLDNNVHVVLQKNSNKILDYKNAPIEEGIGDAR